MGLAHEALIEVSKIEDIELKNLLKFSVLFTNPQYYKTFADNLTQWHLLNKTYSFSLNSDSKLLHYDFIRAQLAAQSIKEKLLVSAIVSIFSSSNLSF